MADERVQRKLAAIMAADVVGYSRLMEADEAGTLAHLKQLRSEVFTPRTAEVGGRIFKITGDGALAEFKSAIDAVQAAVAIQRTLGERNAALPEDKRIELRIGISLGDVIVEGSDLYGNGVNVAARLEAMASPGGICISGNVHDQVRNAPGVGFADLGDQQVKNIDRPVRAYRVVSERAETGPPDDVAAPPLPDKPSIAVLPFQNLSGDPEQEYFADGMTEDLITDLSQVSALFVIARNSSFVFKGQHVDVKDVGQKLGVRYVLEGSVRKVGAKVRINAQLIDAASGGHLWARRYDGDVEDIFGLQDEITAQIVSGLEVSLTTREKAQVGRALTHHPEAYDLFLRARGTAQPVAKEGILYGTDLLRRAVALDPGYADAHSMLGYMILLNRVFGWREDATVSEAVEAARHAVALDDASALAHAHLGWITLFAGDRNTCVAELERAVALDPNGVDAYYFLAEAWNYMCEPERSLEISRAALRRNPLYTHGIHIAHSHYLLGDHESAISILADVAPRASGHPVCLALLAATSVALGRTGEAVSAVERLRQVSPRFTRSFIKEVMPYRVAAMRDRLLDDLGKAGLPE